MQDYINYIIGVMVVLVLVVLGYLLFMGGQKPQSQNTSSNDLYSTSTQEVATTQNEQVNLSTSTNTNTTKTMKETYSVKMETSKGSINLVLNSKIAPKTVENFVTLANSGFYNGIKFHRVIEGFMIQGGDPLTKDDSKMNMWGTGGPGYKFADEIFDTNTYKTGYKRGVLAMANSGPNTNGSQFFIMHKDTPLPPDYTIFGKIKEGDEASFKTLDAIAITETGPNDRPAQAVVINKITVEQN